MKRWLFTLLILFTLLPLCSCYRHYQIEDDDFTPHIVLHSLVQADSLMHLSLSRSWLTGETPADTLSGAAVTLWINGKSREFGTAVPHRGDHLRLRVEAEGLPAVEAETVVPHRVKIDSLRCRRSDRSDIEVQVELAFQDPVGRSNFYGLGFYSRKNKFYGDHFILDISKEPLFAPLQELGVLDDVVSWSDFYYYGNLLPFSDLNIDGQTYTLNVAFRNWMGDELDEVLVCLYTFSDSYYLYLLSLLRLGINVLSDYGLADPNLVYTNVADGLGIFAACQMDTVHLSLESIRGTIDNAVSRPAREAAQ